MSHDKKTTTTHATSAAIPSGIRPSHELDEEIEEVEPQLATVLFAGSKLRAQQIKTFLHLREIESHIQEHFVYGVSGHELFVRSEEVRRQCLTLLEQTGGTVSASTPINRSSSSYFSSSPRPVYGVVLFWASVLFFSLVISGHFEFLALLPITLCASLFAFSESGRTIPLTCHRCETLVPKGARFCPGCDGEVFVRSHAQ